MNQIAFGIGAIIILIGFAIVLSRKANKEYARIKNDKKSKRYL